MSDEDDGPVRLLDSETLRRALEQAFDDKEEGDEE